MDQVDQLTAYKANSYKVSLTHEEIKIEEAFEFVTTPKCGAVFLFSGITRDSEVNTEGDSFPIKSLYYEAYTNMAIKLMKQIAQDCLSINGKVFICHRLGEVKVGESSLVIAASSVHRNEAHELVMKVLNQIKKKVPIWKKIIYNGAEMSDKNKWSEKSEAFWLAKGDE